MSSINLENANAASCQRGLTPEMGGIAHRNRDPLKPHTYYIAVFHVLAGCLKAGKSQKETALRLNAAGMRSIADRPWTPALVSYALNAVRSPDTYDGRWHRELVHAVATGEIDPMDAMRLGWNGVLPLFQYQELRSVWSSSDGLTSALPS